MQVYSFISDYTVIFPLNIRQSFSIKKFVLLLNCKKVKNCQNITFTEKLKHIKRSKIAKT